LHIDWPNWGVILSYVRLRLYNNSRTMEKAEMKLVSSKKMIGAITLAGTMLLMGIVGFAQQQQGQGQGGQERAGREWHGRGGEGKGGRHGGGMRDGFGGRFAEKLNLTDAQKAQMEQIAARYRESFKAQRGQGEGRRGGGEGFGAFNGGTFNEAAVRATAQARANARVEMEVSRARMMSEMYNVLTAEQKAQLATERRQREQKRQERRANRQGNSGQNQ
jgi:Spy/CpxP family protein refolding chaperone